MSSSACTSRGASGSGKSSMHGGAASNGAEAEMMRITIGDVLSAVTSLYDDRLKPFGRVILKRIRENYAAQEATAKGLPAEHADPENAPRVDPRRLRRICENCKMLQVLREEGREYSVLLLGESACFVDVCSIYDVYPQEMWMAAATYFESLAFGEMVLPGGRYACARALFARRLPFLEGRYLGEICHIVQMAISQKRLLGYREGHLVPFQHSEEWVKEQCAYAQQPTSAPSLPLATIEDARAGLWELLHMGPQPGGVTLSNVKRLFRSRFEMELSETALGHSRLHSLLIDPRLSDICCVEAQRSGQVMVRPAQPPMTPLCYVPTTPMLRQADAFASMQPIAMTAPQMSPMSMPRIPPGTFSAQQQELPQGVSEFAEFAIYTSQFPQDWMEPRKGLSSCSTAGSATPQSNEDTVEHVAPVCIADGASDENKTGGFCSGGHVDLRIKNTFIHFGSTDADEDEDEDESVTDGAESTCSSLLRRRRRRARSLPRSFGSPADADMEGSSCYCPSTASSPRRHMGKPQPPQQLEVRKQRALTLAV